MGHVDQYPPTDLRPQPASIAQAGAVPSHGVGTTLSAILVYRKTAKGLAEVETRAHRLPPQLRGALVMVDGRRSTTELAAMWPKAVEVLSALAEQGFVELAPRRAPAPTQARPEKPTPAATAALPPAAAAAKPAVDFVTCRRDVLRCFNDLVGPAGELLSMKIEKTQTLEAMRQCFPAMVKLVGALRGHREAEALAAKLSAI